MKDFQEHEIEWNNSTVSRLWDYYSKTPPYNDNYFAQGNGGHVVDIFLKYSDMKNPIIVDFGGGKGFIFEHLMKKMKCFKYYNLDFSADSVLASKERLESYINFQDASHVKELPVNFESNFADVVFLTEVIEHLNDDNLQSTLNEIYRLLKPGGILVLTAPNNEDLDCSKNFCPECGAIYHKWQHERVINKNNIVSILSDFNFTNFKVIERTFNKPKSKVINLLVTLKQLFKKPRFDNLVCIATKI